MSNLPVPLWKDFQGYNNDPASNKRLSYILAAILILAGLGFRWSGLGLISIDMHDFLLGWYDRLAADGFVALREPFSNYTPPYLYLLFLVTKTAGFLTKVTAIKLLSVLFDFLNAFLIYRILKIRFPESATALTGACSFLLLPTVLLNSAYWGQSDAVYTCFLLACILFLMKDQPLTSMIFLGVAFSFKAQASFLGPLVLLLIVKKRIPWFYLGMIPFVYALMMIPAALTGRSVIQLFTIYASQADTYHALSVHAPNPYLFIPDSLYTFTALFIGVAITVLVVITWTAIYACKIEQFTPQTILLCALAPAAFMPFFLPKMHDRYFYLADVLSFLAAFYFPRGWLLAVGYQFVSGLVYSVFLISSITPMRPILAGSLLIGAALINMVVLGYVIWTQWKLTIGNIHIG